jgi:hypothetical protein
MKPEWCQGSELSWWRKDSRSALQSPGVDFLESLAEVPANVTLLELLFGIHPGHICFHHFNNFRKAWSCR